MAKSPKSNTPPPPFRLIGYARVSIDDQVHERAVRGGRKWQPSSVKALMDEAFRFGLLRN